MTSPLPTAIPPPLHPYLLSSLTTPSSLTLLTSTLSTPANWVLVRFLHVALRHGQVYGENGVGESTREGGRKGKVVFVSVWRGLEVWCEVARKCGLNLRDEIASGRLIYIDGLSMPPSSTATTSSAQAQEQGTSSMRLASPTLKALTTILSSLVGKTTYAETTIVIDGIDFILAADPLATSLSVRNLLVDTLSTVRSLVVTCAADEPLMHNMDASATPLEYEHGMLLRSLGHAAEWVIGLRELETGFSTEVDGTIRIGRGGAWSDGEAAAGNASAELEGGEWLFRVGGNDGVRVWGRGET